MKTLTVLFIAGFIFAYSTAADWVIQNIPDWVSGLIIVIGLPCGAYAFFKMLFKLARGAK